MDWFKKHADTLFILGSFAYCFWTLNIKMDDQYKQIRTDMGVIEKEVTMIKTVLIMKHIMPPELAKEER